MRTNNLTKQQLTDWFAGNGLGIGVPFPLSMLGRVCKSALNIDQRLFAMLGNAFEPHNKHLVVLKFRSWEQLFLAYCNVLGN